MIPQCHMILGWTRYSDLGAYLGQLHSVWVTWRQRIPRWDINQLPQPSIVCPHVPYNISDMGTKWLL